MKTAKIVADGPLRFQLAKAKAAKESEKSKTKNPAVEIAPTKPAGSQKFWERSRAANEVRHRTLNHEPSASSLW